MDLLKKYFSDFTPLQERQFEALAGVYRNWNDKINVISRKDMDSFYEHHVLHSLAIATQFNFKNKSDIMDLGTGGGFPGIPLAVLFPEVNFHLVDSINKKLQVALAVADELEIKNITTQHTRAEEIKNRKFDVVVSRAVAPLKDLWHWSKPLLKKHVPSDDSPNGLVCLKGGDLSQEIFESKCKPYVWEIEKIFKEEYFRNKYLIYQPN